MAKGMIERIVEESQVGWDGHQERLEVVRQSFRDMIAGLGLVSEVPYKLPPNGLEDSPTVQRSYAPVVLSVFPDKPESTRTHAVLALPYVKHGPTTIDGSEVIERDAEGKAIGWQSVYSEGPAADLVYGFSVVEVHSDASPNWQKHIKSVQHDPRSSSEHSGTFHRENDFAPFLRELIELEQ